MNLAARSDFNIDYNSLCERGLGLDETDVAVQRPEKLKHNLVEGILLKLPMIFLGGRGCKLPIC